MDNLINLIKEFFVSGWTTLKGILTLKWLNFKNWKSWTGLRALYLLFALLLGLGLVFNFNFFNWALPTYFVVCAFFKTEPLLKLLNRFGFTPTEL
jgi:hypothetical protein|tara:strand:+ start:974 stop:1258 length:285 start_codon:yes stop_codon:yes gene_type:complete